MRIRHLNNTFSIIIEKYLVLYKITNIYVVYSGAYDYYYSRMFTYKTCITLEFSEIFKTTIRKYYKLLKYSVYYLHKARKFVYL